MVQVQQELHTSIGTTSNHCFKTLSGLSAGQQEALEDAFHKRYSWELERALSPSPQLLGRIRREFEKLTPAFFPLAKVQSAKSAIRTSEPKRQRVTESVSILMEHPEFEDPGDPSVRLRAMFLRLEILCNGWAIAGVSPIPNTNKVFCSWQESTVYYRTIKDRIEVLTDAYPEDSVCRYFLAVEEAFRHHAIDMVRRRDNPLVWGAALKAALKEYPVVWSDFSKTLQGAKAASSRDVVAATVLPGVQPLAVPPPSAPAQAKSPGKTREVGVERGKIATVNNTSQGAEICKHCNDSRGCKTPCPRGNAHVCDVLLASGKVCEKKHTRGQHDESQHGKAARRPNS
jgi:hypothetical protein